MFLSLLFFFMVFFLLNDLNLMISLTLINSLSLSLDLKLSFLSMFFSMNIILISLAIFFYNKLYFNFNLILSYKINLMIFIFSMILLVNSNSMLSILIGWDGLGISSFFLVSYYSNLNSSISSLITFFFNRLGDSFMMIFFCMYIFLSNKLDILNLSIFMLFVLLMGLFTKSSQIPFGVWLPMAMSAPTPISSLVHSSTLVTAGIFILLKMNFLFFILEIQFIILLFSTMTFFLGGLFSIMIMDMKKTIAFSTLSQLGFILFSLSMGNFSISFYHLIFHALFKSLLFINLGYFMIMNFSIQDMRQLNSNSLNIISKMSMVISILNLMGFFFSCGFISKDMILLFFFNNMSKFMMMLIFYISCLITITYSMKILMFLVLNSFFFMKMNFNMKFNINFIVLFFFSLILNILPNFLINFLTLDLEIFLSNKNKFILYLMIFLSFFMFKNIFLNFSKMLFSFSSMMMILDSMNLLFMKTMVFMNNIFYLIQMTEEMIQMNILKKINNNIFINYKMLFLSFNILFSFMLMKFMNFM